jgi:dihydroorotase
MSALAIFVAKEEHRIFLITSVISVVAMVVPTVRCVIEHLHTKVVIAFVQEVQQAADLLVVGASELLSASVEEHLAFARRT